VGLRGVLTVGLTVGLDLKLGLPERGDRADVASLDLGRQGAGSTAPEPSLHKELHRIGPVTSPVKLLAEPIAKVPHPRMSVKPQGPFPDDLPVGNTLENEHVHGLRRRMEAPGNIAVHQVHQMLGPVPADPIRNLRLTVNVRKQTCGIARRRRPKAGFLRREHEGLRPGLGRGVPWREALSF
jgi:hypothetical protein